MPLDRQARAWLEASVEAGVRPYHKLGVERARQLVDGNAVGLFGALDEVEQIEEIAAAGIRVRTYRPAGGENRALVWLHGGGWVIGSLDSHDPRAARSRRAPVLGGCSRLPPRAGAPAPRCARRCMGCDAMGDKDLRTGCLGRRQRRCAPCCGRRASCA